MLVEPSETLTLQGFRKSRFLPAGSVLVNAIGNIGTIALLQVAGSFNQQINGISPFNFIDSNFLYWLLQAQYVQNQMVEKSSATTIAIMNKSKFNDIKIAFPGLEIQKNISNIINKIDSILEILQ